MYFVFLENLARGITYVNFLFLCMFDFLLLLYVYYIFKICCFNTCLYKNCSLLLTNYLLRVNN